MPSRWLRSGPTKLKKCQERRSDSCSDETDGCCAVIPCTLCLEWQTDNGTSYGSAVFSETMWTGAVGGHTFNAYWERNEYGICEFVVVYGDTEVYRADCDNGASCRNPNGEAAATVDYEDGTLHWSVYEPRELQLIDDPDTGCRTYFCDDCRCSCDEICVDVSEVIYGDFTDTYSGTLANIAYPCDPPVWAGPVGNFNLSLSLGRDEYGQCILIPVVNGNEQEPVLAPGCASMAATIELTDGSTITVRCKQCDCPETIGNCICGRPLGPTMQLLWSSGNGTHGSAAREFTLTYGMINEPTISCAPWSPGAFPGYRGSVSGTFPLPMGGTKSDTLHVIMVCECTACTRCVYYYFENETGTPGWILTDITSEDCNCPAILTVGTFSAGNSYQISDITIVENESNC